MKLVFENSLAVLMPFGFLDVGSSEISDENEKMIVARGVNFILVSFKNVVFFTPNWIHSVLSRLQKISQQNGVGMGVCDYNDVIYELLIKSSSNFANLSFFQTKDVASIFFASRLLDEQEVAIVIPKTEQRNFIEMKLGDRGYRACVFSNESEARKHNLPVITSKTHILTQGKNLQIFTKSNIVVYRASGMIDSSFVADFNSFYHSTLLRSGFKFFIFWINITSGVNSHGANFLIKLADFSAEYGAIIAVCGLRQSNISEELYLALKDASILVYNQFTDFLNDDSILYMKKRQLDPGIVRNINKNIIDILPFLMSSVVDVLSSVSQSQIVCVNTRIESCKVSQDDEMVYGCVCFYGDFDMRVLMGINSNKIEQICQMIADKNDDILSSYTKLFSIITDKILRFLILRGINTKVSIPKIFTKEDFFDNVSKGAFIDLNLANANIGKLFIGR
ncbi:hypothetical protein CR66_00115 [Campylobacter mucosalis]|uniref:hypothetical protein n=1 Tax=Campylobacter mucosalis TaxID=202 RepID=UPI0004D672AD|nr:hypothetical protein [Campylobacter mucosalis]KEA46315.1 hypothetical protein CR66_00115 [Campylobacter mucosalis]QKF63209.1 hypothetical protein CMCT_1077 [Campylobacter mucosalis]